MVGARAGGVRAGADRCQCRQRCRGNRDLRQRWGSIRLPHIIFDGSGDCGAGRGAGDVFAAGCLYRRRARRPYPRAVFGPGRVRRDAVVARRQCRADRQRIRGRWRGDGDLRGFPEDLGAHSRPVRLGANGVGHLLACRAAVSDPDPGVSGLPDRRVPRPPQLEGSGHQPGVAPFFGQPRVSGARDGADRHHYHSVHAVLRGFGLRGQTPHARRLPQRTSRRGQRLDLERCHQRIHHHCHRRRDRRQRTAGDGRGCRPGAAARRRPGLPLRCLALACSEPRCWPPPWFRCRPRTPSPTPSAPSAR